MQYILNISAKLNYTDTRCTPVEEMLEDRIGARLRSRLYEMSQTVLITGEDWRRRYDEYV